MLVVLLLLVAGGVPHEREAGGRKDKRGPGREECSSVKYLTLKVSLEFLGVAGVGFSPAGFLFLKPPHPTLKS